LAIAKEAGNWAGEGQAYGTLGNAYQSQGDYAKGIEHLPQYLAISKEFGDLVLKATTLPFDTCHMHLNERTPAEPAQACPL